MASKRSSSSSMSSRSTSCNWPLESSDLKKRARLHKSHSSPIRNWGRIETARRRREWMKKLWLTSASQAWWRWRENLNFGEERDERKRGKFELWMSVEEAKEGIYIGREMRGRRVRYSCDPMANGACSLVFTLFNHYGVTLSYSNFIIQRKKMKYGLNKKEEKMK